MIHIKKKKCLTSISYVQTTHEYWRENAEKKLSLLKRKKKKKLD